MYAEDRLLKALFKMSVQNKFIISIILYKKNVALCLLGSGSTKPRHEGEAEQLLRHADRKAHTSEGNNCLLLAHPVQLSAFFIHTLKLIKPRTLEMQIRATR